MNEIMYIPSAILMIISAIYFRKTFYFFRFMFITRNVIKYGEKQKVQLIKVYKKKRFDINIVHFFLQGGQKFDYSVCVCEYRYRMSTASNKKAGYKEYTLIEPLSSLSKKERDWYSIYVSTPLECKPITMHMRDNNYRATIEKKVICNYSIYCLFMGFLCSILSFFMLYLASY